MSERPPNRLIHATSPYLLQHAHNPVDWHPWGAEALALARRLDRPIFLSIGYTACHWCHVMERESFEDEAVAGLLNTQFVPIKVDREERPDLDELYMAAVQALTGRGGWPMSVWLTPELKPFYGGTYFPPTPRFGLPGFGQLLEGVGRAWRERRGQLEADASQLTEALAHQALVQPAAALPGPELFEAALDQLRRSFDARWGGFGPAPKFPQAMAVELILRRGTPADQAMARRTLDAMADGGMFDHLGGGFARYSVDEKWLVPHFEKMLYDNAQLATCYLGAFQATGAPAYAGVARATLDYLLRDLRDPSGGFHASEDADSEGHEGRFYVFTPDQVEAALGARDGARFCRAYGITAAGNFDQGASVLHRFDAPPGTDFEGLGALRERLRAGRDARPRPAKDDKVLAGWNGLALTAFARGFQVLGERRYLDAALALAAFLLRELAPDGALLRSWRQGQARIPGFLEDHAAVACGLVDLYEASFDPTWLRWAGQLAETMRARFEDPAQGGFFGSPGQDGDLLFRQKPLYDGALPSGNTLAARALLRLAGHLEHPGFRDSAERALRCAGPLMARAPAGFLGMLSVLDLAGAPQSAVITGDPEDPRTRALVAAARGGYRPNLALSLVAADPTLPLHQHRDLPGPPAAFVCRGQACAAPVEDPDALEGLLSR
ncbi:MAG: thioredoxin domain-containing protein [Holophaga sp.]|nr:thioredoxin domain-containing protein [Holophaga sp.]